MRTLWASNPTPLILALLTALLMSGCSADNNPDTTQNPTASQSTDQSASLEAAPSTSPTEYIPASANSPAQNVPIPEYPDEAREETAEGAEAFMKFWWTTMDYLMLTGDPGPMFEHSADVCHICELVSADLSGIYQHGGWVDSESTINANYHVDLLVGDITMVMYDFQQLPNSAYHSDGSPAPENSVQVAEYGLWEAALDFNPESNTWVMIETTVFKNRQP